VDQVLLETDLNDITQVVYTVGRGFYGPLLSQYRGATPSFYLYDGLGSTDRLTDISATVTDSYVYQAFGNLIASTGTTTNLFRYGTRFDYYLDPDLAYYWLNTLSYSPSLGRLLGAVSPSAVGSEANLYRYVPALVANRIDRKRPRRVAVMGGKFYYGTCGNFAWPALFKLVDENYDEAQSDPTVGGVHTPASNSAYSGYSQLPGDHIVPAHSRRGQARALHFCSYSVP
jgi:hypothetical protein